MNPHNSQPEFPEEVTKKLANPQQSQAKTEEGSITLRRQLLLTIMPTVMIPLLIASGIGYRIIHQNAEKELEQQLLNQALLAVEAMGELLEEATQMPKTVVRNPYVIKAVKESMQLAEAENLQQLSLEQLEKRFAANKLLKPNQELNNYLRSAVETNGFGEIFFTNAQGLNVAYSNPTSDFVQRDEDWWQKGKSEGTWISEPEFDESAGVFGIEIVQAIKDPQSGAFLGVMKAVVPSSRFEPLEGYLEHAGIAGSRQVQMIEARTSKVLNTFTPAGRSETQDIVGGEIVASVVSVLTEAIANSESPAQQILEQLKANKSLKELKVSDFTHDEGEQALVASFIYRDKQYSLATIFETTIVASASIDRAEVKAAGNQLILVFLITAAILGAIAVAIVLLIARQIAAPLGDLASTAEQVAEGNLDIVANPVGTQETQTLANSFNNLVKQVKKLLQEQSNSLEKLEQARQQAEVLAKEQEDKNQVLQLELMNLLQDVEGASTGDLTVHSQIVDGEIGIVADFFNSIIESLRQIVSQVKQAAENVNTSVGTNKGAIAHLAEEARHQADQITVTLNSVEEMTRSIQEVAHNAQTAAEVTRIAASQAETGGASMERTVNSILQLQETITGTADKVKHLGEASQQISRVISLIKQIAMQTNLLAINASIEAARAGQEGRGFAVVAEEVGELAAQSATATKEIEKIIASIQKETIQVVEAMEIGTVQVQEGTRLVENTKESLQQIVQVSLQINQLVESISGATVSQARTSQSVTKLMKEIAQVSEQTSATSREVSNALEQTVGITQKLQASVGTFKVEGDS
jgi:twitching motility protein PilJ